jgi:hypothetical protein
MEDKIKPARVEQRPPIHYGEFNDDFLPPQEDYGPPTNKLSERAERLAKEHLRIAQEKPVGRKGTLG